MLRRARCRAAMLALKGAAGGDRAACSGRVTRLTPRGPSGSPEAAAAGAAAAALEAGGLVALPTDTIYGLACLAQDSRALAALYRLKGRAGSKPLAVCLPDVPHVYRYCKVRVPDELLHDLLPGPVTLVLERSDALNKDLNPFTPLVGVRIPGHWFVREVAKLCAAPLALTSANLSNKASSLTVTEFQELWPHLALIVDAGPIGDIQSPECRLGSTVVDLSVPGKFKVIRPGCALAQTVEILESKYGLRSDLPSS
ncbi:threonylcarbamoyl-AMP synthase [Pogona vitticeps]